MIRCVVMAPLSDRTQRTEHLFIVRVWFEHALPGGVAQWRGSVEHVATKQRFYFANFAALNDFMTLRVAGPAGR